MKRKKQLKRWITILLSLSLLTTSLPAASIVWAAEMQTTIQVNPDDGTVTNTGDYNGPQVEKIRVLTDGNFLEIYWDRYVDENEAIDINNFILKNGNTKITLIAKASDWTDTLYFDKNNREVAATSANSMARLDSSIHMSSICYSGTIDPSKGLTLEIIGDTIVDNNGNSAQNAVYTNIPYISFYTRFVVSDTGIVVKGDDTVAYSSLEKAAEQIDIMLSKTDTGIAANMVKYGCSLAVYSPHQNVYMIPEHRYGFRKDMYDVEGYGGSIYNNCVSSIAEQNIIRTRNNSDDWYMNTMYRDENILIHEFGHCVKSVGMDFLADQTLRNDFLAAYDHAKRTNLWPNTYCISNEDEFFATMCAIWFNVMAEARNWQDGTRGPVNTREELQQYDPHTYEVFAQLFPDTTLPAPWNSDIPDYYHDTTYDPNWKPEPEPSENKTALKKAISRAEMLDPDLYAESAAGILEAAITEVQKVYYDDAATQLEIDLATAKITRVVATLPPIEDNFAISATATTSHVSSWESLAAVNDGAVPSNSYNPSIPRYGSWGNSSAYETITYTWDNSVVLRGADIYLWYDGTQNNYTSGGIKIPREYYYEYLDVDGIWKPVTNASAYSTAMNTFNPTTFDKVTTTAIRITLVKQTYDSTGVGVMEWKVYGTFAPTDKTELVQAIANAGTRIEKEYTVESWTSFQEVLALANKINNEDVVSQEELQLIISGLESAQTNLVPKEAEPVIPEILADFDFDNEPAAGGFFDGGNAKATGAYTLVERENGKALSLKNGQFLTVTGKDGSSLLTGVNEMTVSFLFKPERSATNWAFFAAPNEIDPVYQQEQYVGIFDNNGSIVIERYDNNGARPYDPSYAAGYGDWYHVTAVLTAATENTSAETILYINGVEVARQDSLADIAELLGENSVLFIGKSTWTDNDEFVTALIDNYKIYSRALTAEEVAAELIEEPLVLPYIDVTEDEWYYDAVYYNFVEGLMTGKSTTIFAPDALLSRAEFASVLYAANELPDVTYEAKFSDIYAEDWYADAVIWASQKGIVNGYGSGLFGPADPVAREQIAIMMYNYAAAKGYNTDQRNDLNAFNDAGDVSWYAQEAMQWAVGAGVITGKDGGTKLDPYGATSRAECAAIMQKFMLNCTK